MRSPSLAIVLLTLILAFTLASETRPTGAKDHQPAYTNNLQLPVLKPQDRRETADEPPAYTPLVTAAPNQDEVLASKGYYQTTFYKCKTEGSKEERCGWHTPILKAQARRELSMGVVIPAVLGAAGVFAWGLL